MTLSPGQPVRLNAAIQPAIESAGLRYQGLIVWDKEHMGLGNGFRCQHELALHFTFGSPEYHNKGTPNVLRCRRVPRNEREHQTQKPVELLQRMVEVVSPLGGVVLDPFSGSGTTGVACRNIGRTFIGIEIEESYLELTRQRFVQRPLFPVGGPA